MGPELMEQMRRQAQRFGADLRAEDVESVSLTGDVTEVIANGVTYRSGGHPGDGRRAALAQRAR
jgi:thioredoxin reductase (NADPH)